jgi:hypothetical protein
MSRSDLPPLEKELRDRSRRPLAIPVLGGLGLGFGLFRLLFAIVVLIQLLARPQQRHLSAEMFKTEPGLVVVGHAWPVVTAALSLLLVIGSVGVLRSRRGGMRAVLAFAGAELCAQAASVVSRYAFERPALARLGAVTGGAEAETVFWFGVLAGVGMAVLCLHHFRRSDVRRALGAAEQ